MESLQEYLRKSTNRYCCKNISLNTYVDKITMKNGIIIDVNATLKYAVN